MCVCVCVCVCVYHIYMYIYIYQTRGCSLVGGLTGSGHKGSFHSDENVLSWVHHISSPPCLMLKSNRLISYLHAFSLLFWAHAISSFWKSCPQPLWQVQILSILQDLVKNLPFSGFLWSSSGLESTSQCSGHEFNPRSGK